MRPPSLKAYMAATLLGITILTGCSGASPITHELGGIVILQDTDIMSPVSSCAGLGGYEDLHDGAQVSISDETGETVAVVRLTRFRSGAEFGERAQALTGDDVPADVERLVRIADVGAAICPFQFEAEVPASSTYSITIGAREPRVETQAGLEERNWGVIYTIGQLPG